MNLPTLEAYLEDFTLRCSGRADLIIVRERVERGECPFLDCVYNHDAEFRMMRRFYSRNIPMLQSILLSLLDKLLKEVN